jgi:hypothetical protein
VKIVPHADQAADRVLVESALAKRRAGGKPSRKEAAALKRFEAQREEDQRWAFYRSVPQRVYNEMAGRQWATLVKQARLHGMPYGRSIDLVQWVGWLTRFLEEHPGNFVRRDCDDPLLAGRNTPALERYRNAKADLAHLELLERTGELLPIDKVHEAAAAIAQLLRNAGDALQRRFGRDALEILDQALAQAEEQIAARFAHEKAADTTPAAQTASRLAN